MAWTGNFKDQIDDLAGTLASADDAAIQQWILDGCYDVLSKATLKHGEDEVWKFVAKSGDQTSNDIDIDEIRTIAAVVLNGVFATKGKWQLKAKYADSNSIYAATANDPVWYLDDSKLSIYPAPAGGTPANYYYIPEYAITNWNTSTSSIDNYPSEYYYHAMLYAAVQVLHRRMVDYTTPTELSSLSITAVVPDEIPAPAITSPGVATIAKPDISSDVPTYTAITVTSGTLGALASQTIADLSIKAVSPDTPTIAEINYTPPAAITVDEVSDLSDSDVADLVTGDAADISIADIVAVTDAAISTITGASSNQPTYIPPVVPDALSLGAIGTVSDASPLGRMEDYVSTEEDTELSNAMGSVMSTQINEYSQGLSTYQAELSDAVNAFNEENTIYGQLVQQAVQNANATNQANLQNMQKDLQINQANNQKLINQAQTNQQKALQLAQANQQKDLNLAQANHQEEIQRKITNANNAQTKAMQDAIQQVQDTIANNSSLISEYQANLAVYQAEVNTEVQEYTQNFQKDMQLWQQTNTTRLQEHSQRMQDELNNFNELNVKYQANVQAELAKHQTDVAEANKEADLTIQAAIQDYTLELQKWQQLLAQYQADVNTQVNEYTNNIQKFSADLQAKTKGYEWLESQYNKLRSTYESLFVTMPSGAEG